MKPRLLCLSGSARAQSTNTALLNRFAGLAAGIADASVYRSLAQLPIFNPDIDGPDRPAIIDGLEAEIRNADGLVIACPEYAHGIPGGFKNLLDWLVASDALYDKPTILVHANGHGRGTHVRSALVEVLSTVGIRLIDEDAATIYLVSKDAVETEKILSAPENEARLRQAAQSLVARLGAG